MTTRITHSAAPLDHNFDGPMEGTVATHAYYVEIYGDVGDPVDEAGPFDDEIDAVMAERRILEDAGVL